MMPRPMSKFRIELPKVDKHSFKQIRNGSLAYCKYGSLATYAQITQCDKKVIELQSLGYNVYRQWTYPFLIILNTQSN